MSMSIYLQMMTDEVLYPAGIHELTHRIWPEPFATDAEAATLEDGWLENKGQIFVIRNDDHQVVGITGYFDVSGSVAYLRWTGVLPEFRNQGIFRRALHLLTLQLKGANPELKYLIELVPDNDYGKTIAGAFVATGFYPDPNRDNIPEGEDADWPCIPYVLSV